MKTSELVRTIRVVMADDSALMRKKIREVLESDPDIRVVACVRDGATAVAAVREHNPDVVTLDINMPVMDGLTALQKIMHEFPRPVVMISSLTREGALATYECLELGAVDFVPKLGGTISTNIDQQGREIIAKVKAAAQARVSRAARTSKPARPSVKAEDAACPAEFVVAIGVSTGGPKTLLDVIPHLPRDLKAAVVIVQHMPETFTATFADSLNKAAPLRVKEAAAGEILLNSHVYVARGGKHLVFSRRHGAGVMARYVSYPTDSLHMPSVDVMMHSALEAFGPRIIGVLLTGMGIDGADGLAAIRKAGGNTIAEAQSTCVVFGMPAAAIARNAAEWIAPSYEVAEKVVALLRRKKPT